VPAPCMIHQHIHYPYTRARTHHQSHIRTYFLVQLPKPCSSSSRFSSISSSVKHPACIASSATRSFCTRQQPRGLSTSHANADITNSSSTSITYPSGVTGHLVLLPLCRGLLLVTLTETTHSTRNSTTFTDRCAINQMYSTQAASHWCGLNASLTCAPPRPPAPRGWAILSAIWRVMRLARARAHGGQQQQ